MTARTTPALAAVRAAVPTGSPRTGALGGLSGAPAGATSTASPTTPLRELVIGEGDRAPVLVMCVDTSHDCVSFLSYRLQ